MTEDGMVVWHHQLDEHEFEWAPGVGDGQGGLAPSVFPSREPGVSGDFWGSQEGCQGPFRPSGRNRGLPLRRRRGQGPHLAKRWEPRGFS